MRDVRRKRFSTRVWLTSSKAHGASSWFEPGRSQASHGRDQSGRIRGLRETSFLMSLLFVLITWSVFCTAVFKTMEFHLVPSIPPYPVRPRSMDVVPRTLTWPMHRKSTEEQKGRNDGRNLRVLVVRSNKRILNSFLNDALKIKQCVACTNRSRQSWLHAPSDSKPVASEALSL